MNAKGNRDKNQDEYSFIQEKVVPKTKNTKKKFLKYALFTIVLGVIFGIISSLVFNVSNHMIEKWYQEEDEKEPISLEDNEEEEEESPLVTPSEETVNAEQTYEGTEKLTDQDIYRAFDLRSYQKIYSLMRNMSEELRKSMVTVIGVTDITSWFEMENSESSYGLILSIKNDYIYILCNYSKVSDVNKIKVEFFNKETIRAELMDYDKETELAILKVKSDSVTQRTMAKIEESEFGDSYQLTYGNPILGLGSPDGTMYSMEIGYITTPCINKYIVDGKLDLYHTNIMENEYGEGFFVNMEGKVIGVITHKYKEKSDANIMSFTGISKLKPIIESMLNEKERAYLGVKVCDLSNDDAKTLNVNFGIYITDVVSKSPAFKEGLKAGDVITEIDGTSISSVSALTAKLDSKAPGDTMKFTITRQSKVEYPKASFEQKHITVTLE